MLTEIIMLGAGAFALPYALGPVLVRYTQKHRRDPQFTSSEDLPEEVRAFFDASSSQLAADGFEVRGDLSQQGQMANITLYLRLMRHRRDGHGAIAVTMFARRGTTTRLASRYVEFSSRYHDGAIWNTNNSDVLHAFAPVPKKTTTQLPAVTDPRRLFRVHTGLIARGGQWGRVVDPAHEDPAADLADGMRRELEGQLETGFMRRTEEYYVPTWKGACLMTWGLCWPVSKLRKLRRHARGAKLLRELAV